MKKYFTVALLGWQDALVYRANIVVWILFAILPSVTLMMVWLAVYDTPGTTQVGGRDLPQMMTYYLAVTALSVAITSNHEWEIATQIREGRITGFIVRPIGYFGYRVAQETSYQIIKTAMMLPAFALLVWAFRDYVRVPAFSFSRVGLFFVASFLAFALLTQIKFMLGLAAFWLGETGGFLEIWHILMGLFTGRLLPLVLLPLWLQSAGDVLPFSSLYAFPLKLILEHPQPNEILIGFARQLVWLIILSLAVRLMWRRGLRAYEAFGG